MAEQQVRDQAPDYKSTLQLPHTDFPLRAQAAIDDPRMLKRWEDIDLYAHAMELHSGAQRFILHDGPPYANGNIHLGHAYNKILKDIITKAYRMAGYHVPVKPGWDCHGLPIELKVLKEHTGAILTPAEITHACRTSANYWIDVQRAEFKQLGVVMDWAKPYSTMSPSYEAAVMRAFGIFVEKGFIERKYKTVSWCMVCETTLASAEIEYQDRKDPSVYVQFVLSAETVQRIMPEYASTEVSFLVWTTTPWTLPLNRAVSLKPKARYALVQSGAHYIIIGEDALPQLQSLTKSEFHILKTFVAEQFVQGKVCHPIVHGQEVPIIFDDQISLHEGTASVHVAPGCGPSDYELGVRNDLEIYSPITAAGLYDTTAQPDQLIGMKITDGQWWVLKYLEEQGRLFYKTSLRHSYPHCWRCRNGLIYRATKQWFLDLKHDNLQTQALAAIDTISFIPERGANFLRATVGSRWEWCLSRQRVWGTPIAALICTACDTATTSSELIRRMADGVSVQGIEYWQNVAVSEVAQDLCCITCGAVSWRKETDILDVWFDSGVSHYAVLGEAGLFPADLYLEGLDQYRGWYQSSFLTSLVVEGEPAMCSIMTHGFTVDAEGRKMSKSLGNGVEPQEIIRKIGTDGLRLWVASIGHESDAVVSAVLLDNVMRVYLKVRNTCRFFLQNLYDFDLARDGILLEDLKFVDRCALVQFAAFHEKMTDDYLAGDMTAVFHGFADYCTVQMSAVYCDIIKDRLYVAAAESRDRRSAQTVVWHLLDGLTRLMAPILSFTAEQIADHYQHPWHGSVHLQTFTQFDLLGESGGCGHDEASGEEHACGGDAPGDAPEELVLWETLLKMRDIAMKLLESQRALGIIKHSLQGRIILSITSEASFFPAWERLIQAIERAGESLPAVLQEFFVVSEVVVVAEPIGLDATELKGIFGHAEQAHGVKCPRCWQWHTEHQADGLCDRCQKIIT